MKEGALETLRMESTSLYAFRTSESLSLHSLILKPRPPSAEPMTNTPQVPQTPSGKGWRSQVSEGLGQCGFSLPIWRQASKRSLSAAFPLKHQPTPPYQVLGLTRTHDIDVHVCSQNIQYWQCWRVTVVPRGPQNTWTTLTFLARQESPGK